jgi:hypothetical protein
VLLAWPDTCFRQEDVRHPHTRKQLAFADVSFSDVEISPKEAELIHIAKAEKAKNRRVLVYTTYTGDLYEAPFLGFFIVALTTNEPLQAASINSKAIKQE